MEYDNKNEKSEQKDIDFITFQGVEEEKAKQKPKKKSGGFQSMDLYKPILRGILRIGYSTPTPIQRAVIPKAIEGKDIVAMARTGFYFHSDLLNPTNPAISFLLSVLFLFSFCWFFIFFSPVICHF